MNTCSSRLFIFVFMLASVLAVSRLQAGSSEPSSYCGVHCVYAAAKLLGRTVQPTDLVKPEFISRGEGSSPEELVNAAAFVGLPSTAARGLTPTALRGIPGPVLLLVKKSEMHVSVNHWVLFLGYNNGICRVIDPLTGYEESLDHDLLSRWYGTAVIIGDDAHSRLRTATFAQWTELTGWSVALVTFLLTCQQLLRRKAHAVSPLRSLPIQAAAVLGVSAIACAAGSLFSHRSLPQQSNAVREVQRGAVATYLPKLTYAELTPFLNSPTARIIDARIHEEFKAGSLPNAVSLSDSLPLPEIRKRVADWNRTDTLIVFCRTEDCPYSHRVASRLLELGFSDVRLYPNGWVEWEAHHKPINAR